MNRPHSCHSTLLSASLLAFRCETESYRHPPRCAPASWIKAWRANAEVARKNAQGHAAAMGLWVL